MNVKNILTLMFGLFIALALICAIEFASMLLLKFRNLGASPFLINVDISDKQLAFQQKWGNELVVSYLDPHLGHAHDISELTNYFDKGMVSPGFIKYVPTTTNDEGNTLIVALGGSTTDPLTALFLDDPDVNKADPYNWPRSLAGILFEKGVEANVINGGVAGYSSNQDLLKFIRDVTPFKPKIVLSLEGVNELGFVHSTQNHPMVHRYQRNFFDNLLSEYEASFFPNTVKLVKFINTTDQNTVTGVNYGSTVDTTPAEQWENNFRSAHSIAEEFGIEYLVFLQPILGVGEYDPTPDELQMLNQRGEAYYQKVQNYYAEAKSVCAKYSYCVDLTDVFQSEAQVYLDARHQNSRGVDVIAGTIYDELVKRNSLDISGIEAAP